MIIRTLATRALILACTSFVAVAPRLASAQLSFSGNGVQAELKVGLSNLSGGSGGGTYYNIDNGGDQAETATGSYTGTNDGGSGLTYSGSGTATVSTIVGADSYSATFANDSTSTLLAGSISTLNPSTVTITSATAYFTSAQSEAYTLTLSGNVVSTAPNGWFYSYAGVVNITTSTQQDIDLALETQTLTSPVSATVNLIAGDAYAVTFITEDASWSTALNSPNELTMNGALSFTPAPEPVSTGLLVMGAAALIRRRARRS